MPQVSRFVSADRGLIELTSVRELDGFASAWRDLWERCPGASVFQRPEWLLPWCRHLLQGRPAALVVIRRGVPVGLVPLFLWQDGAARVVSIMGAGVSDYIDVLAEPGERGAVADALERWLARRDWDRLELSEVPSGSILLELAGAAGPAAVVEPQQVCPGLPLRAGASLDETIPASMMARVAYARRRAGREGGLRVEVAAARSWRPIFGSLEELHRARWSDGGALGSAPRRAFHREVCLRLIGRGALVLTRLWVGDQIVAALYGFHDHRATRYYLGGFDPGAGHLSPGNLAVADAIERALARGSVLFDFLRGGEPYKYSWGAADHDQVHACHVPREGLTGIRRS